MEKQRSNTGLWQDAAAQKRWLRRFFLLAAVLLLPAVILAFYARPSADDYVYAARTHAVVQQYGLDLPRLLAAAWDTNVYYFHNWQGLYVSGFVLALQPAIFGNAWYGLTLLCVLAPLLACLYGAARLTVRALAPYVDIWLTDMKYVSSALSGEYSAAPDYFAVAAPALRQMLAQAGPPVFGADGLLQRGVIVRHLALPGALHDSLAVLRFLAGLGPQNFLFSAMSQYTPFYRAAQHKALSRRISTYEYRTVVNEAVRHGLTNGYMQEKSSAKEEYTPPFDLEGV